MKSEDLSDALDLLDEDMILHTDIVRRKGGEACGFRRLRWKRWCAGAACLCLAGTAAYLAIENLLFFIHPQEEGQEIAESSALESSQTGGSTQGTPESSVPENSPEDSPENNSSQETLESSAQDDSQGTPESSVLEDNQESAVSQEIQEASDPNYRQEAASRDVGQEKFVPVYTLLAQKSLTQEEMAAQSVQVSLGEYTGIYEKVSSAEGRVLAESMGAETGWATGWHYVSGHGDLQYLIREEDQDYSLWKFLCFDSGEYPYGDVLRLVYGIDSGEALTQVKIMPATMDNTDGGKKVQKEVGTHMVTDPQAMETLYQALASMTCYGRGRWDLVDYGGVEAAADRETGDHEAVRLGRYLSFTTAWGNEIDGLKYTAVSNMFYEYNGIAYSSLEGQQAQDVWEILGITGPSEEEEQEVGETLLLEADNREAGLDYVNQLQERVSQAMIDHELPFVVVSSVYEQPYPRLHLLVTSREEEDLEKLRAFDTLGGVMEIEYVSGGGVLE